MSDNVSYSRERLVRQGNLRRQWLGKLGTGDSRIENPSLLYNTSIRLFHLHQGSSKATNCRLPCRITRLPENTFHLNLSRFRPLASECGDS